MSTAMPNSSDRPVPDCPVAGSPVPDPAGPVVGIFSIGHDVHAHAVAAQVRSLGGTCHVVGTDRLAHSAGSAWWGPPVPAAVLTSLDGTPVDVSTLSVIWWRRVAPPQSTVAPDTPVAEHALISNEWRAFVAGAVRDVFRGQWVNHPAADDAAGNKIVQLRAASRAGFTVPATLVSADPDDVLAFSRLHGGTVIAKKLVGAPPAPLATVVVSTCDLAARPASISACPTMYQEIVPGYRHLRINCFGDTAHAFLVESAVLDWRRDLTVPFTPYELDGDTRDRLAALLRDLGLRMAVVDAKLTDAGQLVWLELNVQGQFLFCEGLTGYPLARHAARFLLDEARQPAAR
jgi:hypothetical protein